MKKTLSLLLCICVLSGLLCGCGRVTEYPVHIEGSIFSGSAEGNVARALKFDKKWLTKADNTAYNASLAAFSAILCADSYFREKDLDKGTQNRVLFDGFTGEYDFTAFLKNIGFTEVSHIESFREKEYAADSNDSVTMTMGHLNDGSNDIFAVVFRGCFSAQEWVSVFDPGSDTPGYTAFTGEHPEWSDKNNLKGIDIAANRAIEFIDEFIKSNNNPDSPDCILFTGHSRGGAIAQLVGAKYEKSEGIKPFTYAFNTIPVTADSSAEDYKTVFNIFDSGDFYACPLPFGEEKLYRIGTTVSAAIADEHEIKRELTRVMGGDDYACPSSEVLTEYNKLFGAKFPTRASLYESESFTETFDSVEAADERAAELNTLVGAEAGLALGPLCTVGKVTPGPDGKYSLKTEYCGAALLLGYSKLLAYGEPAYAAFANLFKADKEACGIASLLFNNLTEISAGHRIVNSYVLSQFVKP